jgi:hypothetical protein
MSEALLKVREFRSVRGEPALERDLDRLNEASRRPSPNNGSAYLQAFLDHDEFAEPGQRILLLGAHEEDRLVGFVALRRTPVRVMKLVEDKIEFLVTHENDRPCLAARPADELRCARAFYRHLLTAQRGWRVLDLVNLVDDSPLLLPVRERIAGLRTRLLDGEPTAILPVRRHADFESWYRSLAGRPRQNIARHVRRMLAAGRVELVTGRDPRARDPLLELYLDVERRSWKEQSRLGWHPARVAKRKALNAPGQPLALWYQVLLLDGVPVAATICGDYPGASYGRETCYDEACLALGPGHLLHLLMVREVFARRPPELNLLGGFARYKTTLGAELVTTRRLQLFRLGSMHWLKSYLGDLRRRLTGERPSLAPVRSRASAPGAGATPAPASPGALPSRDAERALAARVLNSLAAEGIPVERLAGEALLAALPVRRSDGERTSA